MKHEIIFRYQDRTKLKMLVLKNNTSYQKLVSKVCDILINPDTYTQKRFKTHIFNIIKKEKQK